MPSNYFLINLIMLIMIGLSGYWFYKVWVRPLDMPVPTGQEKVVLDKDSEDSMKWTKDEAAYNIISQKNLFRPSRTAVNIESVATSVSTGDIPKLFGTIIKNNVNMAIIEDPSSKMTRIYNVNDSVAGFKVSEITQNKVVLIRGDEKIEVKLREEKGITSPPSVQRNVRPGTNQRQRQIRRQTTRRTLPRPTTPQPSPHIVAPDNAPRGTFP